MNYYYNSKPPQLFRTLLSILADLNNVCHLISKSISLFTKLLVTVSSAPITIGINVTFMFHSFFSSLARPRYSSLLSLSFNFTLWSAGTVKFTIRQNLVFLLTIIRSGCLAEIRWFVCMSKFQRILWVSFSRIDSRWCIYDFFVWSNLNFLHNSEWITFPTQSCQVLHTFCTYLLYSLFIWWIISSLSPQLLFCCVLSIFALT